MKNKKQVLLIVLDGWGVRESLKYNAIKTAKTPFFDYLWDYFPHATLKTSGKAVGLPAGKMGNSEVGHMTLGTGRVINSDIEKINSAIKSGEIITNAPLLQLFEHVTKHKSTLHIKGLVSPGGVHSHIEHLYAMLKTAKDFGIKNVVIHAFTDGRDTPPQSAHKYLKELEDLISKIGIGFIATVSGRFYAMDRDNNWDRLKKTEDAIFHGKGKKITNKKPSEFIKELHKQGFSDEYFEPLIFLDEKGNSNNIKENDGVLFFNFRADRARMLSKKMAEKAKTNNICFLTMTNHDEHIDCLVSFPIEYINTSLASIISSSGLSQTHIAETEKYAHVTYFFNGRNKKPHKNEKHILIESRKDINTHDEAPKMRAKEIADAAVKEIKKDTNFIVLNFANADMVGHTANFPATIKAVEELDIQLKRIFEAALKNNSTILITSDHGNAELTFDEKNNSKHTAHTTNPVPIILTLKNKKLHNGSLKDVAPTILELFDIKKPKEITGKSLLKK